MSHQHHHQHPHPALPWQPLHGPLAAEILGDRSTPRIVFVHGFTQTGESWKPFADHFTAHGRHVVVVDLPGHGGSAGVRADLRRTADLLAEVGGPATYVGYSLGGRVCLHLALSYPHLVERLVLIGAHPGIADVDERADRRASDDRLAQHLREVGLDTFLAEWEALPLFGGHRWSDSDRAARHTNTVEGLASSLTMAGTGAQESLWPRLRELTMPVTAIAGALDTKFAAIAEQIAAAVPRGRCVLVPDTAHTTHLQDPVAAVRAIDAALHTPR